MAYGRERVIFWYGIPAYGHVYSNIYLAGCLAGRGFRVVYYSLPDFEEEIERNGCEYRSYPVEPGELVLTDGSRIRRLYRLILEYTQRMLPVLLEQAERERPCAVIFDSLALWGRAAAAVMRVPAFSFYSIAAIRRVGDPGFWEYARGFAGDFRRYAEEIPRIRRLKRELRRDWGIRELGLTDVLMNRGDWNLMGYSRRFQPGGADFDGKYWFLGPMAMYREVGEKNDFVCRDGVLIYISLGTIFNQNARLLQEIVRQLGRKKGEKNRGPEYSVVMVWGEQAFAEGKEFPENFIVRRWINQGEVMQRAALFITAGGLNSIHEALFYGVPCLMCPQQGEQLLNARQFERLGFGRILTDPDRLGEEIKRTIRLRGQWNEQWRREMLEAEEFSDTRNEAMWRHRGVEA